ncbi:hypothetical protein TWF481_004975 [Arthrobotrys musiformis]|uniref:Uncharacterized protein n=1 Tax=Arthrobotrys musiformis TaxID=47236 RepID=A0AAV9WL87_9PEZI
MKLDEEGRLIGMSGGSGESTFVMLFGRGQEWKNQGNKGLSGQDLFERKSKGEDEASREQTTKTIEVPLK